MVAQKVRKPRGPRGRGLRSTAGCRTCRSRRLKCDENKPICSNCAKSSRECTYAEAASTLEGQNEIESAVADVDGQSPSRPENVLDYGSTDPNDQPSPDLSHETPTVNDVHLVVTSEGHLGAESTELVQSPSTTASFAPGTAPYQWYELIARDAWQNPESYRFLTSQGSRWSFHSQGTIPSIPLSHSPNSHVLQSSVLPSNFARTRPGQPDPSSKQPWNTSKPITLNTREADYLQHYVDVVGPLLDLFDSQLHFTTKVLRLAVCNEGLLKSILALSASHRSSYGDDGLRGSLGSGLVTGNQSSTVKSDRDMALQYYYETLGYLSQSMRVPGYAVSQEILANAVLISWYEAFESDSSPNWERHLKGVFWIQRSRNSDGESSGLPGAVWWTWLRQDIWAAFRNARKTLTIWIPTRPLSELSAEELACRALYLEAKAVSYAATESQEAADFEQRMIKGDELLAALEDWYQVLPVQFAPLPVSVTNDSSLFYRTLWIHPPVYAATMQTYNSAKILVLLNRPSRGGRQEFRVRQKMLDGCIESVCGIAAAPNARYPPLAMINAQALFIAGQALLDTEHQQELLRLLRISLNTVNMPSKTLEAELQRAWSMT